MTSRCQLNITSYKINIINYLAVSYCRVIDEIYRILTSVAYSYLTYLYNWSSAYLYLMHLCMYLVCIFIFWNNMMRQNNELMKELLHFSLPLSLWNTFRSHSNKWILKHLSLLQRNKMFYNIPFNYYWHFY